MLREDIFKITSELEFNTLALRVFKFQYEANAVYQKFCKLLDKHPSNVNSLRDIPFIPIEFFKSHDILSSKEPIVKTLYMSSVMNGIHNLDVGLIVAPVLSEFLAAVAKSYEIDFKYTAVDAAEQKSEKDDCRQRTGTERGARGAKPS